MRVLASQNEARRGCWGGLARNKLESQYYHFQSWSKVGSDVPLVLFPRCLKLKLPLLYPKHSGCDTAGGQEKACLTLDGIFRDPAPLSIFAPSTSFRCGASGASNV